MIHKTEICGLPVETGDIICTTDGHRRGINGLMWKAVGRLIPGEVDHCVVYVGPGTRCIESGPRGVIAFIADPNWDSEKMQNDRRMIDTLYGVAYPLWGKFKEVADGVRLHVEDFCNYHAYRNTPYNSIFFWIDRKTAFYCSQLPYAAYRNKGIDFNRGIRRWIIYPQLIWNVNRHRRYLP